MGTVEWPWEKKSHNRILKWEPKEQHLSTISKSRSYKYVWDARGLQWLSHVFDFFFRPFIVYVLHNYNMLWDAGYTYLMHNIFSP